MHDIYGVLVPHNTLSHWEFICWQWVANMISFCAAVDYQDSYHFYLERTHRGVLSLAAAQCGHKVMQEMWVIRDPPFGQKVIPGVPPGGYVDVCILNTHIDRTELVECKWVQNPNIVSASKRSLRAACAQAASIRGTPTLVRSRFNDLGRLGVAFAAPWFNPGTAEPAVTSTIESNLAKMRTEPFDAMAWYFPKQLRTGVGYNPNRIVPGVFLVVKKC